jgi:NAD(P)-dependent dehydrogenase (short-subunit alcohol dehydrogenase family)
MILDLFKLDGKVALVTEAGQGLGQTMALADASADIAGLDRIPAARWDTPDPQRCSRISRLLRIRLHARRNRPCG